MFFGNNKLQRELKKRESDSEKSKPDEKNSKMKNWFRRTGATVLLVAGLSLVACGSSGKKDASTDAPTDVSDAEDSTHEPPEDTIFDAHTEADSAHDVLEAEDTTHESSEDTIDISEADDATDVLEADDVLVEDDADVSEDIDTEETSGIITFEKTFGGPEYDGAGTVQQTTDGGYIIAGGTSSFGAGSEDVWLIKTDENGNETWSKTFGGPEYDGGGTVQQTTDGGYIISGSTESFGAGGSDVWLFKTDETGNMQWDNTFGGPEYDGGRVQQTTDMGYILSGFSGSLDEHGVIVYDAWLIKTDEDGDEQWTRTFGIPPYYFAHSLQQTTDGGYVMAGEFYSISAERFIPWFTKTDEDGNEQWTRTFGDLSRESANSVQQTTDGGYILAGYTLLPDMNGDAWLIKTDEEGDEQWNRIFGGLSRDGAYSVRQTADGGYIIVGFTESFGAGGSDVWLFKTDETGNMQWDNTFGGLEDDIIHSLQQTSDGGYILAGCTGSFGAGSRDVYLIKTDENGNVY